jgi:hypothetical protein
MPDYSLGTEECPDWKQTGTRCPEFYAEGMTSKTCVMCEGRGEFKECGCTTQVGVLIKKRERENYENYKQRSHSN